MTNFGSKFITAQVSLTGKNNRGEFGINKSCTAHGF